MAARASGRETRRNQAGKKRRTRPEQQGKSAAAETEKIFWRVGDVPAILEDRDPIRCKRIGPLTNHKPVVRFADG
jgi:hypothetical protein